MPDHNYFSTMEALFATEGRIDILGTIGLADGNENNAGQSSDIFKSRLDALGGKDVTRIHIHSKGGSVMEGLAIARIIKDHPAKTVAVIDGVAGSIATLVALSADEVEMPENTFMFFHKPWTPEGGNADELRDNAEMLDKMETAIVGSLKGVLKKDEGDLRKILSEDTWMTAKETASFFSNVTVLEEKAKAVALLEMDDIFQNAPSEAKEFFKKADSEKNILARFKETLLLFIGRETPKKSQQKTEEFDMDKQEIKDLMMECLQEAGIAQKKEQPASLQEITEAVLAKLADADAAKAKGKDDTEPLAFEGDPTDADAVKAHAAALKQAKMQAAVDWNDVGSVDKYYQTLTKGTAQGQAGGNSDPKRALKDQTKTKNMQDTLAFLTGKKDSAQ